MTWYQHIKQVEAMQNEEIPHLEGDPAWNEDDVLETVREELGRSVRYEWEALRSGKGLGDR